MAVSSGVRAVDIYFLSVEEWWRRTASGRVDARRTKRCDAGDRFGCGWAALRALDEGDSDEFVSSTRLKAQDSSRSFGNRAVLGTASATIGRLLDGPRETWRRIVLLASVLQ